MDEDTPAGFDRETFERLLAEASAAATGALRNLHRLLGGDEEAVGQAMAAIDAAAGENPDEPIVIGVERLGAIELVTLREYIEDHVQDWDIGLQEASAVLEEAPQPLVCNAEEAIRHPGYLRICTALDEGLLRAEIERLEREDHP
jgi:hypothetical protein